MSALSVPVPSLDDLDAWKRRAADSRRSQGLPAHAGPEATDILAGVIYGSFDASVTRGMATSCRPSADQRNRGAS